VHRPFLLLGLATAGALAPLAVPDPVADHYCYTQYEDLSAIDNAPYDGRFTFFRVRFQPSSGFGGRGFGRGREDKKWDHDTPRAERHLMKILEELTTLRPKMDCGAIYAFGEAESFKYPIAYVSEPGFWTQTEEEVKGLRDFVAKGGFIIFDDFMGQMYFNLEEQWRRAFPDLRFQEIPKTHPIFDAFFDIREIPMPDGGYGPADWLGVFEDNDPTKRLIAVATFNGDLGELMEFSDEAFIAIPLSNDAYKIMTNYVIYAMTH
jgi:uncharacterized protein DUF4159